MKNAFHAHTALITLFTISSIAYCQLLLAADTPETPPANATKEQWMQYYDQLLGRAPTPKQPLANDSTNFPNSIQIVTRLNQEPWANNLQPIPSTVIDKGILRNVPYSSYKTGDYEMNVYGDLQNPAAVEIGVYRSLLNDNTAKQHCIEFISSVLPTRKQRDALKILNPEKDSATIDGLTIEFTPPTDEDAYGGWWVSAYFQDRLDASRASDKDLAEITVPKDTPPSDSGWSHSEALLARPTTPPTEVRLASVTVGREHYANAYIAKSNPAEATIYHSTGVATYPIESLNPDIQRQLGFDENAARAYRIAISKAPEKTDHRSASELSTTQQDSSVSTTRDRVYVKDYQTYHVGPRGGVYYYSPSGRKVYVPRNQ
jgi:hypothetical protein